jgi:AraC-like DNA-binding protein
MIREPIPIIRVAYLNLVLAVLDKHTGEYEKILQHCDLPASLEAHRDAYVSLNSVVSFMRCMKYSNGAEELGLCAASRLTVADFTEELQSALLHAPGLEAALHAFCRLAEPEQSALHYRIVHIAHTESVWVGCQQDPGRHPLNDADVEWFSIMSLVTIVRLFAGDDWVPGVIAFQSPYSPGQLARGIFPDSQFLQDQHESGIAFPASLFQPGNITHVRQIGSVEFSGCHNQKGWDFPTSLQKLLRVYLDNGYPDIKLAARIVGISVRTLQRRLSEFNTRYSELVHQAQIQYAKELLADKNLRSLDIAYAVGYRDPSNFSRAFRRAAGFSPQQYRRLS